MKITTLLAELAFLPALMLVCITVFSLLYCLHVDAGHTRVTFKLAHRSMVVTELR